MRYHKVACLMAHFAEVDESNVVLRVLVVSDEQEHRGQEYLADELGLGGTWLQTSYNTRNNIHYDEEGDPDGGVAFRGNHAGPGYTYDPVLDVFKRPQPFPSWVFDVPTAGWEAPVSYPGVWPVEGDDDVYDWDEDTLTWVERPTT